MGARVSAALDGAFAGRSEAGDDASGDSSAAPAITTPRRPPISASSFIWDPAGRDQELSSAAAGLKAGMTAPARDLLAYTRRRGAFDRRAYASAVLAAAVTDLNLAESWVEEEPGNPDAWLLWARVAAIRALRADAEDERQPALLEIAERACHAAAARWQQDPTPHVIALSLDRHHYRGMLLPPAYIAEFGLQTPGPWDRWEQVMQRHAYNREAGQHLLTYLATLPGGDVRSVRALGRWAAASAPRASALQLLPLYADVEYKVEDDPEDPESAAENHRRTETLRVLIDEIEQGKAFGTPDDLALRRTRLRADLSQALNPKRVAAANRRALTVEAVRLFERWFKVPGSMPYLPVRDLSVLAHALHAGGERQRAGAVLAYLSPYAHTFPWSRTTRNPAARLKEVFQECGLSPPHG